MYKNLKIRIILCGKKQCDVLEKLQENGFKVKSPALSKAILETENTPYYVGIREEADRIVTEWEREQGREPFLG